MSHNTQHSMSHQHNTRRKGQRQEGEEQPPAPTVAVADVAAVQAAAAEATAATVPLQLSLPTTHSDEQESKQTTAANSSPNGKRMYSGSNSCRAAVCPFVCSPVTDQR